VIPAKLIQYDRIELIKPERHEELMADLKERTGLNIIKIEIGGLDMLRDMAVIKVYYKDNANVVNSVDKKTKLRQSEILDV
jgi:predicted LPLAT superfamily acyltransferase